MALSHVEELRDTKGGEKKISEKRTDDCGRTVDEVVVVRTMLEQNE